MPVSLREDVQQLGRGWSKKPSRISYYTASGVSKQNRLQGLLAEKNWTHRSSAGKERWNPTITAHRQLTKKGMLQTSEDPNVTDLKLLLQFLLVQNMLNHHLLKTNWIWNCNAMSISVTSIPSSPTRTTNFHLDVACWSALPPSRDVHGCLRIWSYRQSPAAIERKKQRDRNEADECFFLWYLNPVEAHISQLITESIPFNRKIFNKKKKLQLSKIGRPH